MYKGDLMDVMAAAMIELHHTQRELRLIREQVAALEEFEDEQDQIVEAPVGDSGRTLSLRV